MYTEDEKARLRYYDKLMCEVERETTPEERAVLCNGYGCKLARIALRRCEIERDALRRRLSEVEFKFGLKRKGTK